MTKYILLYLSFSIVLISALVGISIFKEQNISLQQDILLQQAQAHFKGQVNTRLWSAAYGGVYVYPKNGLKPNPYLKDNTLKTADGDTLVKINPAWMTRQLSELLEADGFHFRITSLLPINPANKADAFEKRALNYFEKTDEKEYFELGEAKGYRYMGALMTTKSCLGCHEHQGYELGDVRGGISIDLNTDNYKEVVSYIKKRALSIQVLLIFLLSSIVFLIHRQIRSNENLKKEVFKQTQEIQTTKVLLQEILDTDLSFLMVADDKSIILANKTMLNFYNVNSLENFRKKYVHISDSFIEQDSDEYLSAYMENEHWISYLEREKNSKEFRVVIAKGTEQRHFKVHTKEVVVQEKKLNIIIFDDITDTLVKISSLEEKASKDALTQLFNKGKFNEVLTKEIELAQATSSPLCIIFLDIDHFKIVNDTYGHDAGDYVLVELAKILKATVRKGDFVARWGGEEFIITLQTTTVEEGMILAEKIRKNVENYEFLSGGRQAISLGVTQYKDDESEKSFLKRVDEALYEAKNTGRNKSVIR